ncbi:PIN domain-containing protein [Chitinophagaceae bacterium LB-8]|uniref:PIN domain-containing protein n=1 Tax=Paraflavisolibacter caeni TaxID=2982496 RepID=A0A9X2XPK8_9BACT|nr:PIN domain-containing protein [Paraflavisolibacter caeni]MCU7551593.1 PIN domain-containing protein [Paraflavisolibacter caeni]
MIHSGRFTALLDANVLYPAPLRDYLLHLASLDLFKPKWTSEIHDEWIRNLLAKRTDLKRASLEKAKEAMDAAFPDANIVNYEDLISGVVLRDEGDKHVLAAAIRGNVDVIVTFNLKDFPSKYLNKYDVDAQHPDEFVSNLINLDKVKCQKALSNQVKSLKNPPKTQVEVLEALKNCGLENSVVQLID